MPFTSKAQVRKCFALKGRGKAKGWDCEEWAHHTRSIRKLPEKKGAAAPDLVAQLAAAAAAITLRGSRT